MAVSAAELMMGAAELRRTAALRIAIQAGRVSVSEVMKPASELNGASSVVAEALASSTLGMVRTDDLTHGPEHVYVPALQPLPEAPRVA